MKHYILCQARAKDNNNEFIPVNELKWSIVDEECINGIHLNDVYNDYDSANVDRIRLQRVDNNHYYKVL